MPWGTKGFQSGSAVKKPPANAETRGRRFSPWVRKNPLEKEMATHSRFCVDSILVKVFPFYYQFAEFIFNIYLAVGS